MIGAVCKRGNTLSLRVLIARRLDHITQSPCDERHDRSPGANGYLPITFPMLGDHSGVVPPDPIPNSAVKRASANGSVHPHARVGHRQAPLLHHNAQPSGWALCFAGFGESFLSFKVSEAAAPDAGTIVVAQHACPPLRARGRLPARVRIRTLAWLLCPLLNTAPNVTAPLLQ